MTTTIIPDIRSHAAGIETVRAHLDTIRTEIADLNERRKNLLLTTHAELVAMGIEAHIIRYPYTHGKRDTTDQRVALWQDWQTARGRVWGHLSEGIADDPRRGPEIAWRGGVRGVLGLYEVLVVDDDARLFARVPDDPFEESGHRNAVARVRRRAAEDDFRVKLRDRELTLLDPMGTTVHIGDVWSTMLWLEGIDITLAEVDA